VRLALLIVGFALQTHLDGVSTLAPLLLCVSSSVSGKFDCNKVTC
jgi:hypothetical protein